jgi:hypothetical protein
MNEKKKEPNNSSSPVAAAAKFVRLTTEQQRKDFYASLKGPQWWTNGGKKDSERGWIQVFELSHWKCIYCGHDLAASTDALAESTEEHLVPRSLLEPNGAEPNVAHNMAACCAGCNALKGEYVPSQDHSCWKSRQAYVKESFRFISSQRLKNYLKYRNHVEKVLRERAGE